MLQHWLSREGALDPEAKERWAIQARAKVSWGHDRERVRDELIGHGFEPHEAARVIDGEMTRRHAAFRRRGVIDVVWGCLLFIPQISFGWFLHPGALLMNILGVILVARGLDRLINGAEGERGDVMGEDDFFAGIKWYFSRKTLVGLLVTAFAIGILLLG